MWLFLACGVIVSAGGVIGAIPPYDWTLYARVIDDALCMRTLQRLANDSRDVGFMFVDASGKLPSGVLQGNLVDFGDYHQCLSIDAPLRGAAGGRARGKYCMVGADAMTSALPAVRTVLRTLGVSAPSVGNTTHARAVGSEGGLLSPSLGVCVPWECRPSLALAWLGAGGGNVSALAEGACRLPGDKPWSGADTAALVVFPSLVTLAIMSTGYELHQRYLRRRDVSSLSPWLAAFSVMSNWRRLVSPASGAGIRSLDGVRALSMGWVVLGHAFALTAVSRLNNYTDVLQWTRATSSVWVTAAPFAVDSFFMMSGLLLVYTTAHKFTRQGFLRALPLWFVHRWLRVVPALGAWALVTASWLHRAADGPQWLPVADAAAACRRRWWITLLHAQNYCGDLTDMCLPQSWYLSVDMQLYAAAPLVLLWLLSPSCVRAASPSHPWLAPLLALLAALAVSLAASITYSVLYQFPFSILDFDKLSMLGQYMRQYYMNTGPRAPPFAVGLCAGYLLHRWRGLPLTLHHGACRVLTAVCVLTLCALALCERWVRGGLGVAALNAGGRALWALALAGLVVLAHHRRAGAVGWLLSMDVWRVPARLSFAVYLTHYQVLLVSSAAHTAPQRFSTIQTVRGALWDGAVALVLGVALTLLVEAPCTRLQALLVPTPVPRKQAASSESRTTLPAAAGDDAGDDAGRVKDAAQHGAAAAGVQAAVHRSRCKT